MSSVLERLRDAMNSHDAGQVAASFADSYRSAQPVHPNRGFGGRGQVEQNWTSVFIGVPDFRAELLASFVDGNAEWGEWEWRGTHRDGSLFLMRGVTILQTSDGAITDARLYMEPVEVGGGDIHASLQELYEPHVQDGR